MKEYSLNLGCGGSKKHHQKTAIHYGNLYEGFKTVELINFDLDPFASWKDIRGDAHNLPFNDKTFFNSYANHILEHLSNPVLTLKELDRVTQNKVIIRVPNGQHHLKIKEDQQHLYSWTKDSLRNLLHTVFNTVGITETRHVRPHPFLKRFKKYIAIALIGNNEITAVCFNQKG